MLIYPAALFRNKIIIAAGTAISALIIIVYTVITVMDPIVYSAELFSTVDGKDITSEYQISLADDKYGDVSVEKSEWGDSYTVHADFKKKGQTELIINTPDGETKRYDLIIDLFTFEIKEKE